MNKHLENAEHHIAHAIISLDNAATVCTEYFTAVELSERRTVLGDQLRFVRRILNGNNTLEMCHVCFARNKVSGFVKIVEIDECEFERHTS